MSGEVFRPRFANRPIVFQGQPKRIEAGMTGRTRRIAAVLREHVPQRQVQLRLVRRQLGDHGRRRRDHFAEHASRHPIAALDRTGAQARRVLREEDRHRQQPAALVVAG